MMLLGAVMLFSLCMSCDVRAMNQTDCYPESASNECIAIMPERDELIRILEQHKMKSLVGCTNIIQDLAGKRITPDAIMGCLIDAMGSMDLVLEKLFNRPSAALSCINAFPAVSEQDIRQQELFKANPKYFAWFGMAAILFKAIRDDVLAGQPEAQKKFIPLFSNLVGPVL